MEIEKQKGRKETREISVYNNLENIDSSWRGLKSIIKVKRKTETQKENSEGTYYYISSLSPRTRAKTFGKIIRNHWGIESYHYIKDVVLKEDYSKITKDNASSNMSILRNIAINIFRSNKKKKITQAIRLLGNSAKNTIGLLLA